MQEKKWSLQNNVHEKDCHQSPFWTIQKEWNDLFKKLLLPCSTGERTDLSKMDQMDSVGDAYGFWVLRWNYIFKHLLHCLSNHICSLAEEENRPGPEGHSGCSWFSHLRRNSLWPHGYAPLVLNFHPFMDDSKRLCLRRDKIHLNFV